MALRRWWVLGLVVACTGQVGDDDVDIAMFTSELRKGQPGAVNGMNDYCDDPANPCVDGEGDCDADYQCTGAGIVCGTNNGTQYGQWWSNSVCWPSTCENGMLDPGEVEIDNGGPCGCYLRTHYFDSDMDGFGRATTNIYCDGTAPSNWSVNPGDCADTNPNINPGQAEVCGDGIDQDCDTMVDEGCVAATWCVDNDGDGFARSTGCVMSIGSPGPNWIMDPAVFDCSDINANVFPGQTEACNNADDDCDMISDEGVTPPTWYLDLDRDGYPRNANPRTQCNAPSFNWLSTYPAFDCSPYLDNFNTIYPTAPELCDGVDNDCDSTIDEGCPGGACFNGMQDGNETGVDCGGFCEVCSNGPTPSSCVSLPATCGPTSSDNCCAARTVFGADYIRSFDNVGFTDPTPTATVYSYRLDRYEVTVGRFKQFLAAYDGWRAGGNPAVDSGGHPLTAGLGWNSAWDAQLPVDSATFASALGSCTPYVPTYSTSSSNDRLPITCPTWFEAFAFCIWDGGRLPTEAEWNLAAAGGTEQRVYPWSSPPTDGTINQTLASHWCGFDGSGGCAITDVARVGQLTGGAGRWGHFDLGGNAWEWTWDFLAAYPEPCVNCANTTPATFKVIRGGGYTSGPPNVRASVRQQFAPVNRSGNIGFRCARGG